MLCCRQARSRVYSRFNGRWKRCRNLTRRNKAICRSFAASHPPRRLRHKARDCCAKTPQQSLRALCGVFWCWQHKYGIIKPKAAHPVKEEENEQKRAYATFSPSRNNCFRLRSMTAKRHCRHGSGWKVLPLWQRSPLHSLSAGGSCCTGVQTGGERWCCWRWCAGQASLRYCSSCCLPYFRFWYCFCVERGLISLLPLFSVIAFLYGFFSLYLLYFFKQF